ncbi:MAG: alpha/beta hydrolase [Bacteroidota bacterium]
MNKLYLLSGLGADERAFANLSLPETELVHIAWLPISPDLTLREYARQLSDLIPEQGPIHLLGVSFGGIVAQEIGQLRSCKRVFVISNLDFGFPHSPWI